MSRKVFKDRKTITILTTLVLVVAVAVGSNLLTSEPPEFPCSQDPDQVVSIADEQVPMANTNLGSKTTTKTSTKKVKMKTASKKSFSKKLPTTKKTTTKTVTKTSSKEKVVTKTTTVVKTTTQETYKKKSKIKTVKTSVATTVSTTETKSPVASNTSANSSKNEQNAEAKTTSASSSSNSESSSSADGKYAVAKIAPKTDGRVQDAFNKLGFEIQVKSSISYAGKYDTKSQSVTLKRADDTVYHELGHFLAFIAGNMDTSDAFKAVYNSEKGKYTGNNKAYVTQNSSEYFAESFRDYTLNPSALKKARPKTYDKIEEALQLINDDRIAKYKAVYAPYWK